MSIVNTPFVCEDVSEKIKNIEIEKLTAEEALKSRTKLINYIFHEVRNPINVIGIGIEALEEKLTKSNTRSVSNIIRLMKNSIERASTILNDTLDYTKLDTKINMMDFEIYNIGDIVEEVVILNKIKAIKLNINIYTNINDVLYSRVDKDRMFQVFENLLSNAIKFTPPDGDIYISLKEKDGLIIFKIKDTGYGIKDEFLKNVFEPYNNIKSKQNNNNHKGLGIGLSIVKKILEIHSSSIEIQSEENIGTTFSFKILKSVNKIDLTTEHEERGIHIKDKKILIVDDDESNLMAIKELLHIKGFETSTLSDGVDFINSIKNKEILDDTYDLILLDNIMKTMNGKDALIICRNEYDFKGKIAILSGCTTPGDRERFIEAGTDFILEKPFKYGNFIKLIN
jgi:nitrogen-specific signal transduction histidine kinase/CheY-like chemotaxis protein